VLLQREAIGHTLESLEKWLPKWKSSGGKLLYEIDDDLLDAESLRTNHYPGDIEATVEKVCFLVKNADIVHVSTTQLAERFRLYNHELQVIPTALDVDLWRLAKPRQHDKGPYRRMPNGPVRIGYIGNAVHDQDIDLVTEAMQCIEKKYGDAVEIEVIGSFQNRKPTFGKRVALPQKSDYPNFVRWLQERVHWDIGIIPFSGISSDKYNNNLKFFEYAALDMAVIVSACIPNMNVAKNKDNCLVIQSSNDIWIEAMSNLIENRLIRIKYASTARKELIENYCLNQTAKIILESISQMIYGGKSNAI
jgi:glycosyltransferase involved in cell wall biosynthesis